MADLRGDRVLRIRGRVMLHTLQPQARKLGRTTVFWTLWSLLWLPASGYAQTVAFEDNFDCDLDPSFGTSPEETGWEANDPGDSWTVTMSPSRGISPATDVTGPGSFGNPADPYENFLLTGWDTWNYIAIEADITTWDDDAVGLVTRFSGNDSYYACYLTLNERPDCAGAAEPSAPFNALLRVNANQACFNDYVIASNTSFGYMPGGTYRVRLEVSPSIGGDRITCSVDTNFDGLVGNLGDLVMTYVDLDPIFLGRSGLMSYASGNAPLQLDTEFDNVVITHLDADQDSDGLVDRAERALGSDVNAPDTDGDCITDRFEALNPRHPPDSDGDGLINIFDTDSDEDGLPDRYEVIGCPLGQPPPDTNCNGVTDEMEADADSSGLDDGLDDYDGDGLINSLEVSLRTDLRDADSDNDGITDGQEISQGNPDAYEPLIDSNPLDSDTDDDGISDGEEIVPGADGYITDPLDPDTDGDGIFDGIETSAVAQMFGDTDVYRIPYDGTGPSFVRDADPTTQTNPTVVDTDGGGLADNLEDLDQNGRIDPGERDPNNAADDVPDLDGDGLSFEQEIARGTDPLDPDTDGDGLMDGEEVLPGFDGYVTDPLDADTDDDAVGDAEEVTLGGDGVLTSPVRADTDRDGLSDGVETSGIPLFAGNNPNGFAFGGTAPSFVPDADPTSQTDPTQSDTDGGTAPDGLEDINSNGRFDVGERDPNNPFDDVPPSCGDGVVDPGESCDDQNRTDGDGCSATCVVEPGYRCIGSPSFCTLNNTDPDGDGLDNDEEAQLGTDPLDADSDDDGISDRTEILQGNPIAFDPGLDTDPLDADFDDDGISDGEEVNVGVDGFVTDPLHPDTDRDGIVDGVESSLMPVPGGISEGTQIPFAGTVFGFVPDADPATQTNPVVRDTDLGGLPDGVEDENRNGQVDPGERDPNDPADDILLTCGNSTFEPGEVCDDGNTSNNDGCSSLCQVEPGFVCIGIPSVCSVVNADPDTDGLTTIQEQFIGTDPFTFDTDNDGLSDGFEVAQGNPILYDVGLETDPLDADTDDDGQADGEELIVGTDGYITDPLDADTDGDGLLDGTETTSGPIAAGTTPNGVPFQGTDPGFRFDVDDTTQTDPTDADSDDGGVSDGLEDVNQNGRVDPGERDPNNPSDDIPASCGNGIIDLGERCDDGNTQPDDGCSPMCLVERDFICIGQPSVCIVDPADDDNDGLPNVLERRIGTDVDDPDTDNDGIEDGPEVSAGNPARYEPGIDLNPIDADTDDDGIRDGEEIVEGLDGFITNPLNPDTDADGLPDGVESSLGPVPSHISTPGRIPYAGTSSLAFVPDQDRTTQTDPTHPDTDRGTVPDGVEDANRNGRLDPNERDPNDPIDDIPPVCGNGSIQRNESCDDQNVVDGDGCSSICAIEPGFECVGEPSVCTEIILPDPDTDGDGLTDPEEIELGTDPMDSDTDDDGLSDLAELSAWAPRAFDVRFDTNPLDADTDDDGIADGDEATFGTHPLIFDTDGDGLSDGLEVAFGPIPAGQSAGDIAYRGTASGFLPDADPTTQTNPTARDSDGGLVFDGAEDRNRNGRIDPGETDPTDPFDDRPISGPAPELCGNGRIEAEEACDDQNRQMGDGCSATCEIEPGYLCMSEPSLCFLDTDSDGVIDRIDNCPQVVNPDQADDDGDRIGNDCDIDRDGDGFENEIGPGGGGCECNHSAVRSPTSGWLWALVMLPLFWRRKHIVALLLMCVMATPAFGQTVDENQGFGAERFRLSLDRNGILDVEWGAVPKHLSWDVSLWFGYANDPLALYRTPDNNADGPRDRTGELIQSRVGGSLVFALGLFDWVQLGIDLPLIAYQNRNTQVAGVVGTLEELQSFGLGAPRIAPKVRLLNQEQHGIFLAIVPGFTLPSAQKDNYFGQSDLQFEPELVLSKDLRVVRLSGNLGYRFRPTEDLLDLEVNDDLYLAAGAGLRLSELQGPPVEIETVIVMGTSGVKPFVDRNQNHLEGLLGATYELSGPLLAFAGAGVGLNQGHGTPDWRMFAGLRLSQHDHDEDNDGISGNDDLCPNTPEDVDGFEDTDGCPEDDNDRDGIVDTADAAPLDPEDKDGFQDADGRPDPDNDNDGIFDWDDRCPKTVGPTDNYGCPDTNRDGDGLVDRMDRCPDQPEDDDGFEDTDGCPDLDNDQDGVADAYDLCPDIVGELGNQGCPDRDSDEDGVVDRLDNCPKEAGSPENQGCKARQLVVITKERLEILDTVYFDSGRDTIRSISFTLLNNVASVLKAHPEIAKIRIEGHTDSQGRDDFNLDLSERRARSVMAYLVGQGVIAERLEAVGLGETQPIADNKTRTGRSKNRRVEFEIVAPSSEGSQ